MAKAPVPGEVKTRLGREVGMAVAAELAAAALADTLDACAIAFGPRHCHLSLAGDLDQAIDADEILARLAGWTIHEQAGDGLAARLARAHQDAAADGDVVVQIAMDTPQVTPRQLRAVAARTAEGHAVLGPATDGGWWVLAVAEPDARATAAALVDVPMSTAQTGHATQAALERAGLRVRPTYLLRDVDTAADARAVARAMPAGRFKAAWERVT
ncbi:TIGR04282 family arsenosugar biosynthesis glycosyltransferase [Nocardioides speluncae]|uniref:TIGR04282 family arsenosugar biosynthesis glycosyltransferase n=1 Tax=Nocardioides speluncae TaxID=2670337 RepID=UPI0019807039|nr:DUF2064 domain-containing protein [Nocardioides speluncae]